MIDVQLIRITNANRQRFYDLFVLQPFDTAASECTWLKSKDAAAEQNAKITAFLAAEQANLLEATEYEAGKVLLYAHDGKPRQRLKPVAKSEAGYPDFIQNLRKMISVKRNDDGKSIVVEMDPLPVGEEIAILFQSDPSKPVEIATAKSIEKTEYVEQLIAPYSQVPGLPMQLGITEFANGTKILNRFYYGADDNGPCILAASLHLIDPSGVAHVVIPNEDFVTKLFLPTQDWLALYEEYLGPVTAFHRVTSAEQCKPFLKGQGQFSISKTGMKTADGRPVSEMGNPHQISGRFLQHGDDDLPIIQDQNASVLEELMYRLARMHTPARLPAVQTPHVPTIPCDRVTKQAMSRWVGRDVQHVSKTVHADNEAVKIDLGNNAYMLDKGEQLSLHGSNENKHLQLMVEHARDHWGPKFKIDSGSEAVKLKLYILAQNEGLTVVGYTPPAGTVPIIPACRTRNPQTAPQPIVA